MYKKDKSKAIVKFGWDFAFGRMVPFLCTDLYLTKRNGEDGQNEEKFISFSLSKDIFFIVKTSIYEIERYTEYKWENFISQSHEIPLHFLNV